MVHSMANPRSTKASPGAYLQLTTPSCSSPSTDPQPKLNATQQPAERLVTYDNKPEANEVSDSTDYFQLLGVQCDTD